MCLGHLKTGRDPSGPTRDQLLDSCKGSEAVRKILYSFLLILLILKVEEQYKLTGMCFIFMIVSLIAVH